MRRTSERCSATAITTTISEATIMYTSEVFVRERQAMAGVAAQIEHRALRAALTPRPAQLIGARHAAIGLGRDSRPLGDDVATGKAALLQHAVERVAQGLAHTDGAVEPLRFALVLGLGRHVSLLLIGRLRGSGRAGI